MRLTLLVLLSACATAKPTESAVTTVVLVRHAEKAAAPKEDPPLTEAGVARAAALVEALKEFPITAATSTHYARTRTTAAPVAEARGLTVEVVDQEVGPFVLEKHRGQTVLVVGHSNTVTETVAALGAPKPRAICDGEFDRLFIVTVPASGAATVVERTYGAPNADAQCPQAGP